MKVLILGPGCTKCRTLEERIRTLVARHQLAVEINKVTDLQQIMTYNIMMTPGLVIDGELKSFGIVPKDEQLLQWMKGTSQ